MHPEPYAITAKYYDDEYSSKEDLEDLPFYMDQAKRFGGPILELACGTGRILLPLAEAGLPITGVEYSNPMLNQLKGKLAQREPNVRARVQLHAGDMRTVRLKEKFKLVTIPFRPLQHMYTLDEQVAALTTAAHHLEPDGRLIFDVFFPRYDLLLSGDGGERLELEWPARENPAWTMKRFFRRDFVDPVRQYFAGTFIYRTYERDLLVREELEHFKMSYYSYQQLRALFELTGLAVDEEYGNFQKGPLDSSAKEMIFICKRK